MATSRLEVAPPLVGVPRSRGLESKITRRSKYNLSCLSQQFLAEIEKGNVVSKRKETNKHGSCMTTI